MNALYSKCKIFKFMVAAADISIVTLMNDWLLDWSANFCQYFIHFLTIYIFQTRFQDFLDMALLMQPLSSFKWYKNM